jgi:hypothetical protein
MKLTQSELDILTGFQSQLTEMRDTLRTFDLQVDVGRNRFGEVNELQREFTNIHNSLCTIATTMGKRIAIGS